MFNQLEYKRVTPTFSLTEDELNSEFGAYGWQLVSKQKINESYFEYLFTRNKPVLFQIWLSDLYGGDFFKDTRTIDFHWYNTYIPNKGIRFEPMNFLSPEELLFIDESLKVEDWLTEKGIKVFYERNKYNELHKMKEESLSCFLKSMVTDCFIGEMEFGYSDHIGKFIVNIWLSGYN